MFESISYKPMTSFLHNIIMLKFGDRKVAEERICGEKKIGMLMLILYSSQKLLKQEAIQCI